MPATDLATLAQVSAFIPNVPASADNALLAALITASSQSILSICQRPTVLSRSYTETYNGYGETRKMLRRWPVTSVKSLLVFSTSIPLSPGYQSSSSFACGYALEAWSGELPGRPQCLDLIGYEYCWGTQNVTVTYQAGYLVSAEPQTVTTAAATVLQQEGPWAQDAGVVYQATGVALTLVPAGPAQGQYALGSSPGAYVFNTADNDQVVLISYSFVPQPLNQACIEMTAEAYRYRTRIGKRAIRRRGLRLRLSICRG